MISKFPKKKKNVIPIQNALIHNIIEHIEVVFLLSLQKLKI